MKSYQAFFLLLIATMTIMTACKKENTLQDELSKLPPATQTGANTFGCLVNGKAWVAQNQDCFLLCDPSFRMDYDISFGGNFGIDAYWIDSKKNIKQRIDLMVDSLNYVSSKMLNINSAHSGVYFKDYKLNNDCEEYDHFNDSSVVYYGLIHTTKFDLQKGIISGTFEFTLVKPGCDTLKVTNGRFDKQL